MCRLTGSLCFVVSLLALACVGVLAEEQSSNDAAMAGVSAPSYADEASMEAAAPSESPMRLLALPSLNLPISILEQEAYPDMSSIAEGEQRLRDSMRASMSKASSGEAACANKTFGPHPTADTHCFDWCYGEFVSSGTWGFQVCCLEKTCYSPPTFWAPNGQCSSCAAPATTSGKATPAPPPPKPTIDCVSTAQALDKSDSPCRKNGGVGAGGFSGKAPQTVNLTCLALKAATDAVAPPSPECCAALTNFIKGGCTCDNNLARLAHDFAGTDYDTFHAIGRVAQMQCGYGKIRDPCLGHTGTCSEWTSNPLPGTRPEN